MSRLNIALLILISAALPVFSQTGNQLPDSSGCTLTLAQSPTIRGLKLGMSVDQLFTLIPAAREKSDVTNALGSAQGPPNYGVASFALIRNDFPKGDQFAGVDLLYIGLFDNHVTLFSVRYINYPAGPRWPEIDELIVKVAETFGLPGLNLWKSDTSPNLKILRCNGFEVVVGYMNEATSIQVRNFDYREKVEERKAADEERKRREFKP